MKVIVLSNDKQVDTENLGKVRAAVQVERPESIEGQRFVKLYDVVQFPACLVVTDEGSLVELWQGKMPQPSELIYHTER